MLILFLLLSLDFGDPCAVNFGYASEITACLEQNITTVTDGELVKFIENVILYMKNSPYTLLYMGDKKPPGFDSFSAFDTIGDLEKLKQDVKDNGWVSISKPVLHFYEKIFDIVARLKDAHATVIFPFLSSEGTGTNFMYGLPYSFDRVPNTDTVMLSLNDFTAVYEASTGEPSKVGYTISQIDFKKTGGTGPKQTLVALSEFASDLGFSGYDPHADFTTLFYSKNYFSSQSIFRPEKKFNPVVSLVGKASSGGADTNFDIPWLGAYVGSATAASVDALSPLASASTNSHIKRKGNNEPPNSVNLMKNWKLIKDSILKANLSQVLKNQVPDFITDRKKMEEKLEKLFGANEKIRSGRSVVRQMLAANEKMFANAAINLQPIKNDGETFEIYADDTNKIGYISYKSFMPTDTKSFLDQFAAGFKDMVEKITQDGDVIIDVRGNGGGSVGVLEELIDFFFHSTIAPDDLEMDVLLTNANAILDVGLLASVGGQAYHIVNGTKVPITDTSVLATDPSRIKTKTHKNTTSGDITANYTEHVFIDFRTVGTAEGNVYLGGVLRTAYGGYSPFSPQHLYIVSDGYCYSCCGMFTKLAVEMKSARVIGFGKHPTESLTKYMPGSAAGTRNDASVFDKFRDQIEAAGNPDLLELLDMFPPRFERKGVNVAYSDMEAFSRNPAHANETLFFLNAPVQDVLPFQVGVSDEDLRNKIAANIQTTYITPTASGGFCFPGEVRVCGDHSSEHQVWGNQCAGTGATAAFTSDCAFAYCEPGYFQTGVSPNIVCSLNSEGDDDDDAGLIVSLPSRSSVFLLFAMAFTIVGLMFW